MQEITDKLDFIKINHMPCQRQYQKNPKTSHRLGEMFVKDVGSDKGLIQNSGSKEFFKLNNKKTSNPV